MIFCKHGTYLHNILSVLCSILENRSTMLQVFFIQPLCMGVNLLERRIPKLRLLQVDQEVSVDWTTLNETHTVGCSIWTMAYLNSYLRLNFIHTSSL